MEFRDLEPILISHPISSQFLVRRLPAACSQNQQPRTSDILTYCKQIERHSYESNKVSEVLQGEHQQRQDFQISHVLSSMPQETSIDKSNWNMLRN